MTISLTVTTFHEWRHVAKLLLCNAIPPSDIHWNSTLSAQHSLFQATDLSMLRPATQQFTVPKAFLKLAKSVAVFRTGRQWGLLYQILWRLHHDEPTLMSLVSDDTLKELLNMRKAIGRDIHKMKAFVRFRVVHHDQGELYLAFYRPAHFILPLAAPFFKQRFASMTWAILTPDRSVYWDGKQLNFEAGTDDRYWSNIEDQTEDLWLTFYQSIFNPARIKLNAMYNEMPRKYWSTMPETKLISTMLKKVPKQLLDKQKS